MHEYGQTCLCACKQAGNAAFLHKHTFITHRNGEGVVHKDLEDLTTLQAHQQALLVHWATHHLRESVCVHV